ncbi:MAG: arylsulfatase [Lentisphaeria bacterium]|nr:arylsulfatase [Lentisphaeria bacterium]
MRTEQNTPNIILINADDLGYGDLSCYGATKVRTPNIDRLAAEGRSFTDAHAASAVCSPSRYGLLTGTYPVRRNFWGPTGMDQPLSIDPRQLTLASMLKEAGYATAAVGKWHLGLGEAAPAPCKGSLATRWNGELKPGPLEIGFDYFFGVPNVNCIPPYVFVENHRVVGWEADDPFVYGQESVTEKWPAKGGYHAIGGARKAHELYRDERNGTTFKEKAVDWIERQDRDVPFFLYFAPLNIHHPFTPAPRFKGTSQCGLYGDFIHELDWMVGELIDVVEQRGQTGNTLIIFTSDNGGMLNQGGQDAWRAGHRLNGDLLGFKFGAWEGGHRIPFIARWPGCIPAGSVSDKLFSQIDLMATFATITGRPLEEGEGIDSINQLGTLTGQPETPARDELLISPNSPDHLLARKGNWVYIPAQDEGGFRMKNIGDHGFGGAAVFKLTGQTNSDFTADGKLKDGAPPAQLYDLERDPRQTTNVYTAHPGIVAELDAIVTEYRKRIGPYEPLGFIAQDRS